MSGTGKKRKENRGKALSDEANSIGRLMRSNRVVESSKDTYKSKMNRVKIFFAAVYPDVVVEDEIDVTKIEDYMIQYLFEWLSTNEDLVKAGRRKITVDEEWRHHAPQAERNGRSSILPRQPARQKAGDDDDDDDDDDDNDGEEEELLEQPGEHNFFTAHEISMHICITPSVSSCILL